MIPLGAVTSVTRLIASTLFRAFAASISFCSPLAAVCGKPYLIIRVCTERIATAPFFFCRHDLHFKQYRVDTVASHSKHLRPDQRKNIRVLKWPLLELRRQFIGLVQMYLIIFGHCDIHPHMVFDKT